MKRLLPETPAPEHVLAQVEVGFVCVCIFVCVCVCLFVCMCERERVWKREKECMCVHTRT